MKLPPELAREFISLHSEILLFAGQEVSTP
jgi:hypothetical protein